MMYVNTRFELDKNVQAMLRDMSPQFGFNGFGEVVYYRTYSRVICKKCRISLKFDGIDYCVNCGTNFEYGQESWADTVTRVTNGTFSIRKDWYVKNNIRWDESFWQHYARNFATSMFNMEWLPPGRGLWAMGTDFVYQRGSMALQNCGFINISDNIGKDVNWMMDACMCGVGVGFNPMPSDDLKMFNNVGIRDYVIADSREGWCDATQALIESYLHPHAITPRLIYDEIRPAGQKIRGFGGISSGPGPLKIFHEQIRTFFENYATKSWYDTIHLKADIVNAAGCAIIAGNVRRSAELLAGDIDDIVDLKNYEKFPYREVFGWMSNNSVFLRTDNDFERLGEIADRIRRNGEPGFINCKNLKYGRIGKDDNVREDEAVGFNPCGEQPLENYELCTLAESCPTKCIDESGWLKALEYATMYASTVTLLPTHRPETNAVMLKNRRIGVGIMDIVNWQAEIGTTALISTLRSGYKKVRATNRWLNTEAGVPEAIRVTTIKPGGTTPKLPGVVASWNWPTFGLTLRRMRTAQDQPIYRVLVDAGIPHEPDVFSANTDCFEFAIDQGSNGTIRSADNVSVWEQAAMLVLLQREWSDNAVSNTLYFRPRWKLIHDENLGDSINNLEFPPHLMREFPLDWLRLNDEQYFENDKYRIIIEQDRFTDCFKLKIFEFDPTHEEDVIENVLASIAPLTKSVSMLPHSPKGVYRQMPEEGINREEYEKRRFAIRKIDWSKLSHSDGIDEKYCQGASCEVPK